MMLTGALNCQLAPLKYGPPRENSHSFIHGKKSVKVNLLNISLTKAFDRTQYILFFYFNFLPFPKRDIFVHDFIF